MCKALYKEKGREVQFGNNEANGKRKGILRERREFGHIQGDPSEPPNGECVQGRVHLPTRPLLGIFISSYPLRMLRPSSGLTLNDF